MKQTFKRQQPPFPTLTLMKVVALCLFVGALVFIGWYAHAMGLSVS